MSRTSVPLLLISCFLLLTFNLSGQEAWDLERCILFAQENSFQVKQADLQIGNNELTLEQAKSQRYPSLSASGSYGLNFGRSIDITSYQFTTQTIQVGNLNVNANVPLYTGGRILQNIEQSKQNLTASSFDKQQVINDLSLNVAQAYLSVLLAEEVADLARKRQKQTQLQKEQTEKLIRAGSLPENALIDWDAQLAANEQSIVNATNAVDIAYLNLKLLMNYDPMKPLTIVDPVLPPIVASPKYVLAELYTNSLLTQPDVKAAQAREMSALSGVKLARTGYYPTVSAFAGLGTSYSSISRRYTGNTTPVSQYLGEIPFGTDTIPLSIISDVPETESNPLLPQMGDNFNQNIGISFNIPIYSQQQNKIAVDRAKLNVLSAQLATEQTKQQLNADLQRAQTDVVAAAKRYQAAEKSIVSLRNALDNAEKRNRLGTGNVYDFGTAQNNLAFAESELAQAKYDYIFKNKILDFYAGKPITLD